MKTPKKFEDSFRKIEEIRYDNVHGGSYAYLQFMAYTRDLIALLDRVKDTQRYSESLEAMSWLFNEYMTVRFTHTHRAIFEEKKVEIRQIFDGIRELFRNQYKSQLPVKTARRPFDGKLYHAQAA